MTDLYLHQLAQQAMLWNMSYMIGRRKSADALAEFFLAMQALLPVDATLEIGAHEATFSRQVHAQFPDRLVRAFEPNPRVFAYFLLVGDMDGISYRHCAIVDRDGVADFHIYSTVDGKEEAMISRRQSLLRQCCNGENEDIYTTVHVPLARLDSLCAADAPGTHYALWIAADGAGGQVLDGADHVLEHCHAIYMEMESVTKFQGQRCDREIITQLLERDFIPVLRDFQSLHQYNVVFVRKNCLPRMEHLLHKFLGDHLRHTLQAFSGVAKPGKHLPTAPEPKFLGNQLQHSLRQTFSLLAMPEKHVPVAPPPLPRVRCDSVAELREMMEFLPLLRKPCDGLASPDTVAVCEATELDEAVSFYKNQGTAVAPFYVLGSLDGTRHTGIEVHPFEELTPGMDIQLWFRPGSAPIKTAFQHLTLSLHAKGITRYHIEAYCLKQFWQCTKAVLQAEDWETVRCFVNALDDAESQYTYLGICQSRLHQEPGYIPQAGNPQYFYPLVVVQPGDVICECGIDDGGSTLQLAAALQGRGHCYAFEPVPNSCVRLREAFFQKPEITLVPSVLWCRTGNIHLVLAESDNSRTLEGEGNSPCVCIDEYFANKDAPTVIKLDVEGAEPKVLEGARKTMTTRQPRLMVCIYHNSTVPDWLTIPRMLLEWNLDYEFFVGHYRAWYAESVLYAKSKEQY